MSDASEDGTANSPHESPKYSIKSQLEPIIKQKVMYMYKVKNNAINRWMEKHDVTVFEWEYTKTGVKINGKIFYPKIKTKEEQIKMVKESVIPQGNFCATDNYRSLGAEFWKISTTSNTGKIILFFDV